MNAAGLLTIFSLSDTSVSSGRTHGDNLLSFIQQLFQQHTAICHHNCWEMQGLIAAITCTFTNYSLYCSIRECRPENSHYTDVSAVDRIWFFDTIFNLISKNRFKEIKFNPYRKHILLYMFGTLDILIHQSKNQCYIYIILKKENIHYIKVKVCFLLPSQTEDQILQSQLKNYLFKHKIITILHSSGSTLMIP